MIFDDLDFGFVPYTPFGAYGQSKTANALLSVAISNRWSRDGILSNTLNPERSQPGCRNIPAASGRR